jgi:hypothetical protein
MCSVTWVNSGQGSLALAFSRDERHVRPEGLPPQVWERGGFLAPCDSSAGGTWLAVRKDGAVLALLNHYPRAFIPQKTAPSRGALIPALAATYDKPSLDTLHSHLLPGMNPFRLLWWELYAPGAVLFTWDGCRLRRRRLASSPVGMLTSSSWQTTAVVAARHALFRRWLGQNFQPSLQDLETFHRQEKHPRGPEWAVCMSRADARTVSLNTVYVTPHEARMTHEVRRADSQGFMSPRHCASVTLSVAKNVAL